MPCRDVLTCLECYKELQKRNSTGLTCPKCRSPINEIIQCYN